MSAIKSLTARSSYAGRKHFSLSAGLLFVLPSIIFVSIFFLWPLYKLILMSFQDYPLLGDPSWIGLDNYKEAFTDDEFKGSFKVTIIYTLIVTPLLFITGLGCALLIKGTSRISIFFRTIFFIPVVIGFGSAAFLWFWFINPDTGYLPQVMRDLGLGDMKESWTATMPLALIMVVLMVVWKFTAFQMIGFMTGLQAIPEEINESASLDGATGIKKLRFISLPLLRRTIGLLMVLSISGSLLAFDQFYIITAGRPEGETQTIAFYLFRQAFLAFRLGYGAALSVILAVLLMIISLIQIKLSRMDTHE